MKYLTLCLIFCISLIASAATAQCFPDRHNTSADASWVSCTPSPSPNTNRPSGFWISYDLGEMKRLGQMQIWNLNSPAHLDDGAKTIILDYSNDGLTWTEWGTITLEAAVASGYYEGSQGPDLDGLEAQHILLTIQSNHGGLCSGLGEIKIETLPTSSLSDIETKIPLKLYPNPALGYTLISFTAPMSSHGHISIINAQGQTIEKNAVQISEGEQSIRLDVRALPSGIFLINVETASYSITQELTVISSH